MAGLERLIYVDDSYEAVHSGVAVFGWVEVDPVRWRNALRWWLELRKRLYAEFSIPPSTELHATKFINGRTDLVTDTSALAATYLSDHGELLKKDLGRDVARRCLEAIRDCPDLRVGACFNQTAQRGPAFAAEKYKLYDRLLTSWDAEMAARDAYAMVVMDGEDSHFLEAHRNLKLDRRHVIEDPVMQDSRRSQWIQMADLVAYTALISLNRHQHNEFGWGWYATYLGSCDPRGGPYQL